MEMTNMTKLETCRFGIVLQLAALDRFLETGRRKVSHVMTATSSRRKTNDATRCSVLRHHDCIISATCTRHSINIRYIHVPICNKSNHCQAHNVAFSSSIGGYFAASFLKASNPCCKSLVKSSSASTPTLSRTSLWSILVFVIARHSIRLSTPPRLVACWKRRSLLGSLLARVASFRVMEKTAP